MFNTIKARTNPAQRSLLLHSGIAFAVRLLGAFSGFLLNLAIARTLPASEAGHYFLVFSMVSILAVFSTVGLKTSFLRFIGACNGEENWQEASAVFRKGFVWSFFLSCSVAALFWNVAPWLAQGVLGKPDIAPVIQAMSPGVVFLALFTLNGHALQALGKVAKAVFTLNVGVSLAVYGCFAGGTGVGCTNGSPAIFCCCFRYGFPFPGLVAAKPGD